MAAAASSLNSQSTDLVQLVSSFYTGDKRGAVAPKPVQVRKPSSSAHSQSTGMIQGVKAKPAVAQKLLMTKPVDQADWESF